MERVRYRYRVEHADGKSSETITLKSFQKALVERIEGDRFFVAQLRWAECDGDETHVDALRVEEIEPRWVETTKVDS